MIVFTNGCFDILHPGHIALLQYCKSLGTVVVGLNSDRSVRELKGDHRPFFSQVHRAQMLRELRSVDRVEIFDSPTPEVLVRDLNPDVIVKGDDYTRDQIVEAGSVPVRLFPRIPGFSTSAILSSES